MVESNKRRKLDSHTATEDVWRHPRHYDRNQVYPIDRCRFDLTNVDEMDLTRSSITKESNQLQRRLLDCFPQPVHDHKTNHDDRHHLPGLFSLLPKRGRCDLGLDLDRPANKIHCEMPHDEPSPWSHRLPQEISCHRIRGPIDLAWPSSSSSRHGLSSSQARTARAYYNSIPLGQQPRAPQIQAPSRLTASQGSSASALPSPSPGQRPSVTATTATTSTTTTTVVAKSSRYLREMDRRAILTRIANGERQVALAKEYQVSRAAICNLNKHREAILSRQEANPLAQHPKRKPPQKTAKPIDAQGKDNTPCSVKGQKATTTAATQSTIHNVHNVHKVQSLPVVLLLTRLRDQSTTNGAFLRYSDRLLRLLVEDALSHAPSSLHAHHVDDDGIDGAIRHDALCGIAMDDCDNQGNLLLRVFHQLEPGRPTGSLKYQRAKGQGAALVDLPATLRNHTVYLFAVAMEDAATVGRAIQSLLDHGAQEQSIWLVSVSVSRQVIDHVLDKFPQIQFVTVLEVGDPTALTHQKKPTQQPQTPMEIGDRLLLKRFLQVHSNTGVQ